MKFPFVPRGFVCALLLCSWMASQKIHACGNDYLGGLSTWLNSKAESVKELKARLLKAPGKMYWDERAQSLKKKIESGEGDFRVESDYALSLMHLGKASEAINILTRLVRLHGNEYNLHANLGTAYELNGEDEKALEWIKRSIEINPNSHQGTEWLHVKILEAKIAMKNDPAYLHRNSILGIDFGKDEDIRVPKEIVADPEMLERTYTALTYQLHERLQFVAPPDAVVADLLFDLGNVSAIYLKRGSAWPFYLMSVEYGSLRAEVIEKRAPVYVRFKRSIGVDSFALAHLPGYVWAGTGGVIVAGVCLFKRKKRA